MEDFTLSNYHRKPNNQRPNTKSTGFGAYEMLNDLGESISWGAVGMEVRLS